MIALALLSAGVVVISILLLIRYSRQKRIMTSILYSGEFELFLSLSFDKLLYFSWSCR